MDSAFPELFGWLGANGVAPAGPPFIRVTEVDADGAPLELDCAAPVAGNVVPSAPVGRGVLPAGRYVTFVHVGPYRSETARDLGAAREDLMAWIDERGIVTSRRARAERGRRARSTASTSAPTASRTRRAGARRSSC